MENRGGNTRSSTRQAKPRNFESHKQEATKAMSNIEAFVTTYQSLFPGTPTPPMPSKPEDLSMTVQLAIRDQNPGLWQSMFGGHGAPLPADVAMRVAKGEIYPEDASVLRASNYDDFAAQADLHRETIINRAREATREREKAQHEAERARFQQFNESSLLERLAASPLSEQAIARSREQWRISGQ
jgi:hypothetical protein